MSCPYTSPQNGKAERIIRTINNVVRSLLFQASMPPSYWVEALSTATVLLNILPTKTLQFSTPHFALFAKLPTYDHLRVFGCKCYPNLSATAPHKLAPRSALCVFLGYSAHHKGYRCLDLSSNRVIISRHVIFDETAFPFAERHGPSNPAELEFLDFTNDVVPAPIGPSHTLFPAGMSPSTSDVPAAPASPRLAELEALPGDTSAPASPSVTVPGAPEAADNVPMPALYIPPALRSPATPSAPRAATVQAPGSPPVPRVVPGGSPPAPRAAPAPASASGSTSPRLLYVPPALRAGSTSPAQSAGFPAPPQAPRGPPPGFPPLHSARDFTYHYSRRPRPPPVVPAAPAPVPAAAAPLPAASSSVPAAAAPLPKGAVAVPPVANQHSMGTRSKSGFRMPAAYHAVPLSPVPKTFRSALADPNWRAAMEEEHSALL